MLRIDIRDVIPGSAFLQPATALRGAKSQNRRAQGRRIWCDPKSVVRCCGRRRPICCAALSFAVGPAPRPAPARQSPDCLRSAVLRRCPQPRAVARLEFSKSAALVTSGIRHLGSSARLATNRRGNAPVAFAAHSGAILRRRKVRLLVLLALRGKNAEPHFRGSFRSSRLLPKGLHLHKERPFH